MLGMLANSVNKASKLWFLVGPLDSAESSRCQPIYTSPFTVGRREGLPLTLCDKTVSTTHAEIRDTGSALVLRDLGSTNGTYLNGRRINETIAIQEDDLVQFASVAFRVRQQEAHDSTHTIQENVYDRALALVQFDKLMTQRAVTPYYQPIVSLSDRSIIGYEVLGRSRLFGLEAPKDMFAAAAHLNLEVELSTMLRWEGIGGCGALGPQAHLFVNTHPLEMTAGKIEASLTEIRKSFPDQPLTLEIHETAVTDPRKMSALRQFLTSLNISLAYDDFGAGQSRLNELIESPPDCLKFDMSLIRGIDQATAQRQRILETLVQMARSLGISPLAEGVETAGESDTCKQMGFELGQGFYYGRPAPATKLAPSA
jgi:EAL domain-containing protein (putative c-di-GMP-specific phosphodiesterase class I)